MHKGCPPTRGGGDVDADAMQLVMVIFMAITHFYGEGKKSALCNKMKMQMFTRGRSVIQGEKDLVLLVESDMTETCVLSQKWRGSFIAGKNVLHF